MMYVGSGAQGYPLGLNDEAKLHDLLTGGIPYPGWTEARTIAEIRIGYRMPKPPHIDDIL